ncbi:MAG: hypothetical protein JW852_06780 [Spirochaetales bacterium]|nr:hypothetical protein [Spirochaetales bacterium]
MSTGWKESPSPAGDTEYVKAGEVTVQVRVWNLLFLKSPDDRAAAVVGKAERKAREEFGPEAVLADPRLYSRWSPYSLFLGLDLLGFAEDATLTADVLIPAPPPPPSPAEPEPKITRISYSILPQDRYNDGYGYIGLEYLTRPQVLEKIKERLDTRNADADQYQKEYDKVPPGGHLVVHIGRNDLMHANTRWYAYTVIENGEVILARKGAEGIPNIKGRDGNWWNEVTIPLKAPIDDSIQVRVADTKQNLLYEFAVARLEEILESGD